MPGKVSFYAIINFACSDEAMFSLRHQLPTAIDDYSILMIPFYPSNKLKNFMLALVYGGRSLNCSLNSTVPLRDLSMKALRSAIPRMKAVFIA